MTDQLLRTSPQTPPDTHEYELLDLLKLINDELTVVLRAQGDDTLPAQKDKELDNIGSHICFELGGQLLAIPLSAVLEVGDLQILQALPLLPHWLSGITNIRGEIVSVVNLALFLDRINQSSVNRRPFLVVHDDTIKILVTVDRVVGTRTLYIPSLELSKRNAETLSQAEYFAGRAIYKEQDEEQEIDLFDLHAFLSSRKLREIVAASH